MPPNPARVRKTLAYLRLEPHEGKLSRAVLRRERRGNPPDPADIGEELEILVFPVNGMDKPQKNRR